MAVYANTDTIVADPSGNKHRVHKGEVWADDDPVVKAHPHLFADEPTRLRRTAPAPVEEATAVPGVKRSTSRKGRADAD